MSNISCSTAGKHPIDLEAATPVKESPVQDTHLVDVSHDDPEETIASSPIEPKKGDQLFSRGSAFEGGDTVKRVITAEDEDAKRLSFPEGGLEAWLVVAGAWVCVSSTCCTRVL